jgi:tRNA(fMet)-specific endonuclease VapC
LIKFLLDTNICIYIIKKSPPKVFKKLETMKMGDVGISSITYCELQFRVANSKNREKNQDALNEFLAPLEILPFPGEAAVLYGEVKTYLKKKGRPIGPLDLLIGVHALHSEVTLITNNTSEFSRIPDLKVKNWA